MSDVLPGLAEMFSGLKLTPERRNRLQRENLRVTYNAVYALDLFSSIPTFYLSIRNWRKGHGCSPVWDSVPGGNLCYSKGFEQNFYLLSRSFEFSSSGFSSALAKVSPQQSSIQKFTQISPPGTSTITPIGQSLLQARE